MPLTGRRLLGVVLRLRRAPARTPDAGPLGELAEATAAACRERRASPPSSAPSTRTRRPGRRAGLTARRRDEHARASARLTALAEPPAHAPVAQPRLRHGRGLGRRVDPRRTALVPGGRAGRRRGRARRDDRPFYRLPDLRLRGLLHLLRDDARLQTFVERELGPLLTHDAQRGGDLVRILALYLDTGRNKAVAAQRAHLSRPAFYERLRRIERVLDADLEDVESCASLHVALLALDSVRRERS